VSVEELRAWLEIEEHALPSVKNPRKRAIDVSKAELDKKADLTFTYQPTKTGAGSRAGSSRHIFQAVPELLHSL